MAGNAFTVLHVIEAQKAQSRRTPVALCRGMFGKCSKCQRSDVTERKRNEPVASARDHRLICTSSLTTCTHGPRDTMFAIFVYYKKERKSQYSSEGLGYKCTPCGSSCLIGLQPQVFCSECERAGMDRYFSTPTRWLYSRKTMWRGSSHTE